MPILFAGLVRAVAEEDELVVAHHWGVTRYIVNCWKQAVAGCKDSEAVYTELALKRRDPEFGTSHENRYDAAKGLIRLKAQEDAGNRFVNGWRTLMA